MPNENSKEDRFDEDVVGYIRDIARFPVSEDAAIRAVSRAQKLVTGAVDSPPNIASSQRPRRNMATFLMHYRLPVFGTAGSLLVVLLLFSYGFAPNILLADTAKAVRAAKSYVVNEVQFLGEKPEKRTTRRSKTYWRAGGERRIDELDANGELIKTRVEAPDRPGFSVDHELKVYFKTERSNGPLSKALRIEQLGRLKSEAMKSLGQREVGGKNAYGFEIDAHAIDSDFQKDEVRMKVWVDVESDLPIQIEYFCPGVVGGQDLTVRMHDIQWNSDLPNSLFRDVAPDSYSERKQSGPSKDEQLAKICGAFRCYSEVLGGHYPRVKTIYPDKAGREMGKVHGFDPFGKKTAEVTRSDEYVQILEAVEGFGWLFSEFKSNPDIKYFGKNVGPEDADKVLVRWKRQDGKYDVIYGDLRHEVLTESALRHAGQGNNEKKTSLRTKLSPSSLLVQPTVPFNRSPRWLNFESAPTCHWQLRLNNVSKDTVVESAARKNDAFKVEEGWFSPNVGMRIEVRDQNKRVTKLVVQNERWRYLWDPKNQTVTASHPGSELSGFESTLVMVQTRAAVIRAKERRFGEAVTYTSQIETLDGEEMERVTFRFLADKNDDNFSPIHDVPDDWEQQMASSDRKFRTRDYWFDSKTKLIRKRRCGCKSPKYVCLVDYPSTLPRELFTFKIPTRTKLIVRDNHLGRVLTSG